MTQLPRSTCVVIKVDQSLSRRPINAFKLTKCVDLKKKKYDLLSTILYSVKLVHLVTASSILMEMIQRYIHGYKIQEWMDKISSRNHCFKTKYICSPEMLLKKSENIKNLCYELIKITGKLLKKIE